MKQNILISSLPTLRRVIARHGILMFCILLLHFFYQFLIGYFTNDLRLVGLYNLFITPGIMIVFLYLIKIRDSHLSLQILFSDLKYYYSRMLTYYLLIELATMSLGSRGTIMVFVLLCIKLPFIEASLYFKDTTLWQSIKDNLAISKNELLKIMYIFVALVILVVLLMFKIMTYIDTTSRMVLGSIEFIQLLSYFLCKVYLNTMYISLSSSK